MPRLSTQSVEKYVAPMLTQFRSFFPRAATHRNFSTAVLTVMSSTIHHGVTDSARMVCDGTDQKDGDRFYENIVKLFKRCDSFCHLKLLCKLAELLRDSGYLYRNKVNGVERSYIVVDGHNAIRSGRYMPGVKKTIQNSESPSKPQHTFAHMWGVAGVLVGNKELGISSLPVSGEIQQGEKEIRKWQGEEEYANRSHVEKMMLKAGKLTEVYGASFVLGDSYFFTMNAVDVIRKHNVAHPDRTLILISRAKKNAKAWTFPPEKEPGKRGRPRVRGERVHLGKLFETEKDNFKKEVMTLYGKEEEVSYLEKTLLWGDEYIPVKFVLSSSSRGNIIFISTDTDVDAKTIIEGYALRWKCELSFKIGNQSTNAFDSHFWTKHMPRLNRYAKKTDPDPLILVKEEDKELIWKTFRAYERYAAVGFIGQALLQLYAFELASKDYVSSMWLRTRNKKVLSTENLIHDINGAFLLGSAELREKLKPHKNKKDSSAIVK